MQDDQSLMNTPKIQCSLCQHEIRQDQLVTHREKEARDIVEYTIQLIRTNHPEWADNDPTCQKCWDYYRSMPSH